jgi:hypothetical protein
MDTNQTRNSYATEIKPKLYKIQEHNGNKDENENLTDSITSSPGRIPLEKSDEEPAPPLIQNASQSKKQTPH